MRKKKFDAVAFTRQIRDSHHDALKDATPEERRAFYADKARQLHEQLGLPAPGHPAAEGSRPAAKNPT